MVATAGVVEVTAEISVSATEKVGPEYVAGDDPPSTTFVWNTPEAAAAPVDVGAVTVPIASVALKPGGNEPVHAIAPPSPRVEAPTVPRGAPHAPATVRVHVDGRVTEKEETAYELVFGLVTVNESAAEAPLE